MALNQTKDYSPEEFFSAEKEPTGYDPKEFFGEGMTIGEKYTATALDAAAGFLQRAAPGVTRAFGAVFEALPPVSVGPGAAYVPPVVAEEQQRRMTRTAAGYATDVAKSPIVQAAKVAEDYWGQAIPRTEQEKQYWLGKGAEEAGAMVPYFAAGAAAPFVIGAESFAGHIINDFEEYKKQGMNEEEAGDRAMRKAVASGITQAAIFKFLPKPLKRSAEKVVLERFGAEGLSRFLGKRITSSAETAALFSASDIAERIIAGRPMLEGVPSAALGGAIFGALTPYHVTPKPAAERRPAQTAEVRATRERDLLAEAQKLGTQFDWVEGQIEGKPGAVAHALPDGRIQISRQNFHEYLEQDIPENANIAENIRDLIQHEKFHADITKIRGFEDEVVKYWRGLSGIERRIERRRYLGEEAKKEKLSDYELGQDAIRFQLQRAAGMTPTEYINSTRAEGFTSKMLTALEDFVRWIRENIGRAKTKAAAKENRARLDKMIQNVTKAREDATARETKGVPDALESKTAQILRPVREEPGKGEREMSEAERRASDDERRRQEGLGKEAQVLLGPDEPLKGEVVVAAAFIGQDGRVYSGPNHPTALKQAGIGGFETRESRNTPQFGYVTNRRPFVSRDLGGRIAKRTGMNIGEFDDPQYPHSDEIRSPVQPDRPLGDQTAPPGARPIGNGVFESQNPPPPGAWNVVKITAEGKTVYQFRLPEGQAPPAAPTVGAQVGQVPPGRATAPAVTAAGAPAAVPTISTTPVAGKPPELAALEAKMHDPNYQFSPEDLARQHELRQAWMRQKLAEVGRKPPGAAMMRKQRLRDELPEELRSIGNVVAMPPAQFHELLRSKGLMVTNAAHRLADTIDTPERYREVEDAKAKVRQEYVDLRDSRKPNEAMMAAVKGQFLAEALRMRDARDDVVLRGQDVVAASQERGVNAQALQRMVEEEGPAAPAMMRKAPVTEEEKRSVIEEIATKVAAMIPPEGIGEISAKERPEFVRNTTQLILSLPPEHWDAALTEIQARVNSSIDAAADAKVDAAIPPLTPEQIARAQAKAKGMFVPELPPLDRKALNSGIIKHLNKPITEKSYPDYESFWRETHEVYPGMDEEFVRRAWMENLGNVLANMSKARAEQWRKAVGWERGEHRGFIPEPETDYILAEFLRAPKDSVEFKKFAAARGMTPEEAAKALKDYHATSLAEIAAEKKIGEAMGPQEQARYLERIRKIKSANNRRRDKFIGALYDLLAKQSRRPERDPMRLKITLDDIDFENANAGQGAYRRFTDAQAKNFQFLNETLWDQASTEGKTVSKFTKRLVVLVSPETGQFDVVSLYRDPNTKEVKIYEPSAYHAGDKTMKHRTLTSIMATHRIYASILLKDPVTKFHQRWIKAEGKSAEQQFLDEIGTIAEAKEDATGLAWRDYQKKAARTRAKEIEEAEEERYAPEEGEIGPPTVSEMAEREREAEGLRPWEEAGELPESRVERGEGGLFTGGHADIARAGAGLLRTDLRRLVRGPLTTREAESIASLFNEYKIESPFGILEVLKIFHRLREHADWFADRIWGLRGKQYCTMSGIDKIARFWYLRLLRSPEVQKDIARFPALPRHGDVKQMSPGERAHYLYREGLKYDALGLSLNHIYEIAQETKPAKPDVETGRVSVDETAFRTKALAVYGEGTRRDVEQSALQEKRASETGRELSYERKLRAVPLAGGVTAGRTLPPAEPPPPERLTPEEEQYVKAHAEQTYGQIPGVALGYPYERPPGGAPATAPERMLPGTLMRRATEIGPRKPFVPTDQPWWKQMPLGDVLKETVVKRPRYEAEEPETEAPAMRRKGYGISKAARKEMVEMGRAIPTMRPDVPPLPIAEQVAIGEQMWKQGANPHDTMERVEQTGMMRPVEDLALVRYWGRVLQRNADNVLDTKGPSSPEYDRASRMALAWQERIENNFSRSIGRGLRGFQGEEDVEFGSYTSLRQEVVKRKGRDLTEDEEADVEDASERVKRQTKKREQATEDWRKELEKPVELDPGQERIVQSALTEYGNIGNDALARLLRRHPKAPGMALKGRPTETIPLSLEDLTDLSQLGTKVMLDLSAKGEFTEERWWKEMQDLVGNKFDDHRGKIYYAASGLRDDYLNKLIAGGAATAQAMNKLKQKRPTLEASKEAIKRALMADPKAKKITPAEAYHVFNYIKQRFLDVKDPDKKSIDIKEILIKGAQELGMEPQRLYLALTSKRSTRRLAQEAIRQMRREREVVAQAANWLRMMKYPKLFRAASFMPRAFFWNKVAGHGLVPMITHAGSMLYNPWAWKSWLRGWRDMYKMQFSGAQHELLLAEMTGHENYDAWRAAGLECSPYRYSDDYQLGGMWRFLGGSPGFDALKTLRFNLSERIWDSVPENMRTKEMRELIADSVNHATGIIKTRLPEVANWVMFAPKLEASRWAYMFKDTFKALSILAQPRSSSPEQMWWAKRELLQKATMVGIYYMLMGLSEGILNVSGSDDHVNISEPTKPDFMYFKIPGFQIGIVSPMTKIVGLFANLLRAGQGQLSQLERIEPRQRLWESYEGRYLRGKLSPFASFMTDVATQQDPTGRPLPWSTDVIPMSRRLKGITPYEYPEWLERSFLPIPLEEVAREMWMEMGMNESQASKNIKALVAGATMAATGARVVRTEE